MKNILVLFGQEWDRQQLAKVNGDGAITYHHEGFDLFSFPSNTNLLLFDIFKFVDKLSEKYRRIKLDGILTTHEQFGALTGALLAERLGLPGMSATGVMNAQHKALARQILAREVPHANVPFATFPYTVKRAEEIALPFPFFAKPIKAAYSVLARRVEDFADLRTHLTFQPWEKFIIFRLVRPFNDVVSRMEASEINGHHMIGEQLVDGFQVNVDGYVRDNQVHVLGIIDAVMYPGTDAFMRWEYPSRLPPEWRANIRAITESVVRALKLDHGLFNVELRVCSHSGDCKVIEVNPRMATQFSDLYEMVDGINLHDLAIRLATAEPLPVAGKGRHAYASSFVYRRFDGLNPARFPGSAERAALAAFDADAQLITFEKRGTGLKREMKWLQSYRYACLNMGGSSETALIEKYQHASRLLGFPAPL